MTTKTNVIRLLEAEGIPHKVHTYQVDETFDASSVARKIGVEPERVFKTLVASGGGTFSAGVRGTQVELAPVDLMAMGTRLLPRMEWAALGACRTWGFEDKRSRFRGENRGRENLESRFEVTESPVLTRKMPGWTERPPAACSWPWFRAPESPLQSGHSPAMALPPRSLGHPGSISQEQAPKSDRLPS